MNLHEIPSLGVHVREDVALGGGAVAGGDRRGWGPDDHLFLGLGVGSAECALGEKSLNWTFLIWALFYRYGSL